MAAVSCPRRVGGGLVGWLGFRAQESHRAEVQRGLFLEVARQGALNLTTISFAEGRLRHSTHPGFGDRKVSR